MSEVGNELEQAKKRESKIRITDIAIRKIRYIEYKNLTDAQNAIMQRLAKDYFMSKNYVLNDLEFDNVPLKIILPSDREECDEEELQKSREKNREIIERMRNDKRYKDKMGCALGLGR